MAQRRKISVTDSIAELALLAPAVAAARMLRMGNEAARGRARATDWPLLASEKAFVAQEAWWSAASAVFALQQQAMASALEAATSTWSAGSALAWWRGRQVDAESVTRAALAPVARRVRRNARRPGR